MKNFFLTAAVAVALSGGLYADTLSGTSTGAWTPFTTPAPSSTAIWTGFGTQPTISSVNTPIGNPFWNNPADNAFGTVSGQTAHLGNIGYLLTDTGAYATTTINVLPTDTMTGGEEYVGAGPAAGTDPSSFSFVRGITSENIALLFADGGDDPTTTIGYYSGSTYTPVFTGGGALANPVLTPQAGSTFGATGTFGFYAIVCYSVSDCDTYTSGNGNSGPDTGTTFNNWNHFALFQTAAGNWVVGFTEQEGEYGEGIGDFRDVVFEVSTNASVPEPGTIGIFGLGLAGLGVLGRRRFAKK
jgi:hypothetical protein